MVGTKQPTKIKRYTSAQSEIQVCIQDTSSQEPVSIELNSFQGKRTSQLPSSQRKCIRDTRARERKQIRPRHKGIRIRNPKPHSTFLISRVRSLEPRICIFKASPEQL